MTRFCRTHKFGENVETRNGRTACRYGFNTDQSDSCVIAVEDTGDLYRCSDMWCGGVPVGEEPKQYEQTSRSNTWSNFGVAGVDVGEEPVTREMHDPSSGIKRVSRAVGEEPE